MNITLSLILIAVLGIAPVLMVMRSLKYQSSYAEIISLAFFSGMGVVSLQFFIYTLVKIPFTISNILPVPLVFLFISILIGLYMPKTQVSAKKGSVPLTFFEKALVICMGFMFLWVMFLALANPVVSHDAVANYALKAKIFYLNNGVPAGFFQWPETVVAHTDYPPLLSFIMTWVYEFTGFNDLLVKFIMPVIYVMFIVLFYSISSRLFRRSYAILCTFILASVPQLADYATIIHADLVFTALISCAFCYFVLYMDKNNKGAIIFSASLFGISFWVKNEAVVFVAAFLVSLLLYSINTKKIKNKKDAAIMFSSMGITVFLCAIWMSFKIYHGMTNSDIDITSFSLKHLLDNVKDIPVMLYLFQQEVFGPKKWNIFWVLIFSGMIFKIKHLNEGINKYMMIFLLISAGGYFAGYMATTGNNLYFYVNTTISRFMLHFTGVTLIIVAELMKNDIYLMKTFEAREGGTA